MSFTVVYNEQAATARKGATLLQIALRAGIPLRHVCDGKASCGTCRVLVVAGRETLSRAEAKEHSRLPDERLEQGWRLACQARVMASGRVELQVPKATSDLRLEQWTDTVA